MRYLFSLFAVLAMCIIASAAERPPQAPRPTQAPPVRADLCCCASAADCSCAPGTCKCPNCISHPQAQEHRWRADGWQQYPNGEWFRIVSQPHVNHMPTTYQSAPMHYAPVHQSFGFSTSISRCGPGG